MRIIIDILHPAHVHFFKNFIKIMSIDNEIYLTSRKKEITQYLLEKNGLTSECISSIGKNSYDLGFELISRNLKFLRIAKQIKADLLMGIMGPTIAIIGKLLNIPSYVFYDSEFASITNFFVYPLASKVITPQCYRNNIGKNHIKYNGYQELAYLHPNYFNPDESIIEDLGLNKKDKYFILRLVDWKASHDLGKKGLNKANVEELVNLLENHGDVFITSERKTNYFKNYQINIPPEKIHSLLYYATMYIGEGVTMASEAAILGTPSILVSPLVGNIGYIEDLERNELAFGLKNYKDALKKINLLLDTNNLKNMWSNKRNTMLENKIDVTQYIVNLVKEDFNFL